MTIFDIYESHPAADGTPQVILIADRFSWFAFFLPPLWAVTYRLWWHALGYLVLSLAGTALLQALFAGEDMIVVWSLALHLIFGVNAAAWRGQSLEKSHYQLSDVRAGANLAAVETQLLTDSWLQEYDRRWRSRQQQTAGWRNPGLTRPMASMFEGDM